MCGWIDGETGDEFFGDELLSCLAPVGEVVGVYDFEGDGSLFEDKGLERVPFFPIVLIMAFAIDLDHK